MRALVRPLAFGRTTADTCGCGDLSRFFFALVSAQRVDFRRSPRRFSHHGYVGGGWLTFRSLWQSASHIHIHKSSCRGGRPKPTGRERLITCGFSWRAAFPTQHRVFRCWSSSPVGDKFIDKFIITHRSGGYCVPGSPAGEVRRRRSLRPSDGTGDLRFTRR